MERFAERIRTGPEENAGFRARFINIARKIAAEPAEEKRELLKGMHRQMTEDIRQVRENSLRELQRFIEDHGCKILTARQIEVLSLRACGKSLGRIAEELGISKTAVKKSIRLSEKKITDFIQNTPTGGSRENVS